jgi:hypothetical protein
MQTMGAAETPARETPAILNGKDDQNRPIFAVLAKRTYDLRHGQKCVRSERQSPLIKVDEYYDDGDPEWATVKYESDFSPFKLATDVVVVGKAVAPGGKAVPQLNASVEVAAQRKTLRVSGDRRCLYRANAAPVFSEPIPFTEMPIQYERAYGGTDAKSIPGAPFFYPRNHLGVGVALKNSKDSIECLPLPNIEDPDDLLSPERVVLGEPERWPAQPLPDGLGWFQRTWYPRCSFVGAMPSYLAVDTVLREEKLGLVPKGQVALSWQFKLPSFDVHFNNGASRGLAFPYLAGDEQFKLTNLTPDSLLAFQLPGEAPQMMLDIGFGENELKPVLHTVCIRLDAMQVDLVWRGAHEYPGLDWLPEMKKLNAQIF